MRGDAEESQDNNLAPSGSVDDAIAAVQSGGRGDDDEAEDGLFPDTATLSAMERRINSNAAFHGFKKVDTKISACEVCKQRLLQFAAAIHCHEVHKTHADEGMDE